MTETDTHTTLRPADRTVGERRAVRPRLLIVGPLPPPFIGPAIATRRLLDSEVIASAFDVDFLDTSDPEGFDDIGRLGVHNVVMALRHGLQCIGALVRRRPDAIYVPIARGLWGFLRDLLFLAPARLFGARVIVHLRAGRFDIVHDNGRLGRLIARLGLRLVDRALVLGSSVQDVFAGAVAPERVRVVPNGLRLDDWSSDEWTIARESDRVVGIAYVANLFRDKGIHVMLEAMRQLRERGVEAIVTFAGDWGDARYRDECLGFVRQHALDDVVRFVGRVDDRAKRALLATSHIAAFVPVKPEGLPWVVLEAMASALPVIGTPQGTIPELVIDGVTGYLVPVGDADALAERLGELAADAALRQRLGAAGRAHVEASYSEERAHRLLADVILECIATQ